MTTTQKGVSFRPSDASAGGYFDDVDARILSMRVESFDFNGTANPPKCCIALTLQDVNNEEHTTKQYYSIGPIEKFTPSADGTKAIPVNESAKLSANSNGMLLMGAFLNTGVPEDKIGDDLSLFDGGVFHFNQTAAPKRDFKDGQKRQKENATILLPTKMVTAPWDVSAKDKKAAQKAAGAVQQTQQASQPSGAPASTPAAASNDAVVEEAVGFIIGQLANGNGTVKKNDLPLAAFKLQSPNRNAITQLVASEAFLGDAGRPWKYENGILTMG